MRVHRQSQARGKAGIHDPEAAYIGAVDAGGPHGHGNYARPFFRAVHDSVPDGTSIDENVRWHRCVTGAMLVSFNSMLHAFKTRRISTPILGEPIVSTIRPRRVMRTAKLLLLAGATVSCAAIV